MTRHRVIMYSPNYKYTHAFHPAVYLALFALVSRHGLPGQLLRHHLGHLPSLLGAGDWTLPCLSDHDTGTCLGEDEDEDDEDDDDDEYDEDDD